MSQVRHPLGPNHPKLVPLSPRNLQIRPVDATCAGISPQTNYYTSGHVIDADEYVKRFHRLPSNVIRGTWRDFLLGGWFEMGIRKVHNSILIFFSAFSFVN